MSEQDIENAATSIISELIEARKGKQFTDIIQIITFVAVICSNASTLENINYIKMPMNEQVNIALDLLPAIYKQLNDSKLIPSSINSEMTKLLGDINKLKIEIKTAINVYDLTAQINNLPSAKDIKKSGISSITSGLKKFKF